MTTPTSPARHVVVADCETTGFDPYQHTCVEIGWWDLNTGERGLFVPRHDASETLARADIEALRINGYFDRLADAPQDHGAEVLRLASALHRQTLAGSNPAFDARFLPRMFASYGHLDVTPWHHRMWDLAPYAAGVLGLDHLPGLSEVCELLGTDARPDHSAAGDVTAAGECFLALFERTGVQLS